MGETTVTRRIPILVAAALLAAASLAQAAVPAASLLEVEREVLGRDASSLFDAQDIGGSDIGGAAPSVDRGPRNLGRKLKAGALSLLLPGLGQLYNGDRGKALAFGGAELAVWTTYGVLHTIARGAEDDYQEYADIYAGVSGDHTERYWRAVGRYMTSEEYNEDLEMEARAEGGAATNLIGPEDAWFWRSAERQNDFQLLRADATRAYDRRDFTVLFAIVNRAIAAYDAVRSAGDDSHMLRVGKVGVDLEPRGVGGKAGTACVASLRF